MRKSIIIKNQKKQINKMIDDICDLENKVEVLQEKNDKLVKALDYSIEDMLKHYKYAIIVDKKGNANFWNNGRFEYGVKGLYFNKEVNEDPIILMEK